MQQIAVNTRARSSPILAGIVYITLMYTQIAIFALMWIFFVESSVLKKPDHL